jgi:hypothetical protein
VLVTICTLALCLAVFLFGFSVGQRWERLEEAMRRDVRAEKRKRKRAAWPSTWGEG